MSPSWVLEDEREVTEWAEEEAGQRTEQIWKKGALGEPGSISVRLKHSEDVGVLMAAEAARCMRDQTWEILETSKY